MTLVETLQKTDEYKCWLRYERKKDLANIEALKKIVVLEKTEIIKSAVEELKRGILSITGIEPEVIADMEGNNSAIVLATVDSSNMTTLNRSLNNDGYMLQSFTKPKERIYLTGKTDKGVLYAAFHFLRILQTNRDYQQLDIIENPKTQLRMINHWDNMDGSIERGYAGRSIFFENNQFTLDYGRIKDYARLMASIGINGISINNVNVHKAETNLITKELLPDVAKVANIFRQYGIRLFLSINYASTIEIGGLSTADPLDPQVREWWTKKTAEIYQYIEDFGGFVVKADSEHRPGPFTYNRNHADGANMLGEALLPFDGIVIWRCFVYDCLQDWRDRTTDRARAAYDHFKPLDGQFLENVILQIKNGPMDFQVREPVSPLFGAMPETNQVLEFQITQEYTGQQKHLCYLIPQWKKVLDFDTYAKGEGSTVKKVVDGTLFHYKYSGISAVTNIGNESSWTGHILAQANLYGYGRLIWNPDLSEKTITDEWVIQTFGNHPKVVSTVKEMLADSWSIYEKYTAPLGVGWMVNPNHHYGPNVDGYEYSPWGTYHFADWKGIGVNRTKKDGTGYTEQYFPENFDMYESVENCPDELVLFFHHVPYTHILKSGTTVIQHIYNTHFEGVEDVKNLLESWISLNGFVDEKRYNDILQRLTIQLEHSKEWRDIINTYFYRKSGINDELKRVIY